MHKYQVLLLEPNKIVRNVIRTSLEKAECFQIHEAETLRRAERIMRGYHIDILLTEILFRDGRLLDIIESREKEIPKFIIVSRHDAFELQEQFFTLGAEDYIHKPFHPDQIRLKVFKALSLLNNESKNNDTIIDLDKYKREVTVNRIKIKLTLTEFQIINLLLENNCYCRNTELLKYLSTNKGYRMNQNALRIAIKRLRDKFRKTTGMDIIKNKHGQGYFIAV